MKTKIKSEYKVDCDTKPKRIQLEYKSKNSNMRQLIRVDYIPGMVIDSKNLISIKLPTGEKIYDGKLITTQAYLKKHPKNKLKIESKLVIDNKFTYPIEARKNVYTMDELTTEENNIGEYKKRVGKTLDTITEQVDFDKNPQEALLLKALCMSYRSIYERKIKLYDYDFKLKEVDPWVVYGIERTIPELIEFSSMDDRYFKILAEMENKGITEVIELADGGFVESDENHISYQKLRK